MSRGPQRDQGSTWRYDITLARRPLSTAWARTCHHFLLILAHLLTHTTADLQESSNLPVTYRELPVSKINDIILSYPPAPPPLNMMSSRSGARADDDLQQLFLDECLQDSRCSKQLASVEAEEEAAAGKRSSGGQYLFRARRGGDSYLFRSRRGGGNAGYLFRSKKGGNYLFRSRRESEHALPTYLGGGEVVGARPVRGSYLFRTRKDEDHSSGLSQELVGSATMDDGPVGTRQTRSKYFFRTRKGERDSAAAENELTRDTRGGQKGYLFRTKKTPAGLVSRSYLFRT